MTTRDEPPAPDPVDPGSLDEATAERLLSGETAGHDVLAAVLALATVPPRPAELTGEQAALTAFRAARAMSSADTQVIEAIGSDDAAAGPVVAEAGRVVDGPRPGTLRARLRFRRPGGSRLLTAKISAVAALAVLGGSGLTLAASTGHLLGQRPAAPAATSSGGPATGSPVSSGPRPSGSGPGASGAPGLAPAASASNAPNAPDGRPNGGTKTKPTAVPSATSSPRPSWFPSAWPSWLPKPSPTQPAGRSSPTGKPKGH